MVGTEVMVDYCFSTVVREDNWEGDIWAETSVVRRSQSCQSLLKNMHFAERELQAQRLKQA